MRGVYASRGPVGINIKETIMEKREKRSIVSVRLGLALVLLLLCAALGACAQTQVRGQYDVAIGGVHR